MAVNALGIWANQIRTSYVAGAGRNKTRAQVDAHVRSVMTGIGDAVRGRADVIQRHNGASGRAADAGRTDAWRAAARSFGTHRTDAAFRSSLGAGAQRGPTAKLDYLRRGMGERVTSTRGGGANSSPATVSYNVPGEANFTIRSSGSGRKSREFTYEGVRFRFNVEFTSEGNRYKVASTSITRA